jgi:hypothetical protein
LFAKKYPQIAVTLTGAYWSRDAISLPRRSFQGRIAVPFARSLMNIRCVRPAPTINIFVLLRIDCFNIVNIRAESYNLMQFYNVLRINMISNWL